MYMHIILYQTNMYLVIYLPICGGWMYSTTVLPSVSAFPEFTKGFWEL